MRTEMTTRFLNSAYKMLLKFRFKNLIISDNAIVSYKSRIDIRDNYLSIGRNSYINSERRGYHAGMPFSTTIFIDIPGAFVKIGDNSYLNGVYVHAQKGITIGNNTVIAAGVNILDSNGHVMHSSDRTRGRDVPEEIVIGNNVWIGINAIILKGTRIGNNSIVAAGAVVKGAFADNSIISGNPGALTGNVKIPLNENSNS